MFDLEAAEEHFERFIQDFNKQYTSEEEKQTRFTVFKENLKKQILLMRKANMLVLFMDLTVKEFVSRYTGLDANLNFTGQCQVVTDADLPNVNVPDSFDWREKNAFQNVTGAVEGQYAIKYGKLQEFSEQQTVDCDEDSLGCGGGLMTSAFSSMIEEGGLESESDYPYIAKSQSCQFQVSKAAVELTGCFNYNLKSQEKLKELVATIGPISIAVKGAPFLTYKGGIISDDACNEGDVNHAILLVGYGTGAVEGQYAIKNGQLLEFSEQQTVDCDKGSGGCGGGLMTSAFSSMIELGGLESETDYPYVAQAQSCQFQASKAAVRLTGCNNYNIQSQERLKELVATVGPISIAVKSAGFHLYTGGVMNDQDCNTGEVNHAILLVGYGTARTMSPFVIVFFACLAACAQAASVSMFDLEDAEEHFERFIQDFNKQYTSEEEKQARFAIFRENLKKANILNAQSEHTRFGITKFTDLTVDEFVSRHTGLNVNFNLTESCKYALKNGKLAEFSEQQTVDCDKGSGGCGGGLMTSAFSTIMEMGGLESETDYPYIAKSQSCQFDAGKVAVKLSGCTNYKLKSQERLKELVATVGPIAIEDGKPYWLAKNSWDTTFGEDGYIKFPRGDNYDSCGVMNDFMASPILA
ncbi:hypothetical protein HF086_008218 [Spodoptera exigua]|uniref:Cathepsin L n=1 Tax=Spodoptera exigua TaxID=7107 RepID=A0A922MHC7_SPOEX|nr:hypothetical protein HF086_008218 [Spodoptera exigua]